MKYALVLLLLSLVVPCAHAVDLYKWVDKDGVTHFSDHPPAAAFQQSPEKKAEEKETPKGLRRTKLAPSSSQVARPVRAVQLYVSADSVASERAKQWLRRHNISFTEYNIDNDPTNLRKFQSIGGTKVPLLVARGRGLMGFSASQYGDFLGVND